MSEEEKKAIKDCDTIFNCLEDMMSEESADDYRSSYLLIKNLIDKQQKEIEREKQYTDFYKDLCNKQQKAMSKMREELQMYVDVGNNDLHNYISRYKIREIIEHYNNELEHIKNGEEFENEKPMYYWGKVALENLLEEN